MKNLYKKQKVNFLITVIAVIIINSIVSVAGTKIPLQIDMTKDDVYDFSDCAFGRYICVSAVDKDKLINSGLNITEQIDSDDEFACVIDDVKDHELAKILSDNSIELKAEIAIL